MSELGWRAKSAQISREAKPIAGLRDDFGVRVKSALEAMRESGLEKPGHVPRKGQGKLSALQKTNQGVQDRAQKDRENLETDKTKEAKRLQALEAKARLYDELQKRVNLDDEAGNDLHEVDFIAKALQSQGQDPSASPEHRDKLQMQELSGADTATYENLHPEEILKQQQEIRVQMQGGEGKRDEYSTYEEDLAHLQARFKHVDELEAMNAEREAEFQKAKERKQGKEARKRKEGDSHKSAILKQLMQKRQRLKPS